MSWQQDLLEAARRWSAADGRVREVRVVGSAADPGAVDAWSDVDLAVLVDPGDEDPCLGFPPSLATPWAWTRHRDGELTVQRVVYPDGRRLDLVSTTSATALPAGRVLHRAASPRGRGAGRRVEARLGTGVGADEALADLRFTTALAVVKFARADLLIGFHLGWEVVRRCLVQAMVLRDRDTGTTAHRHGGPRNEVVARLEGVRRHPWTAAGGVALVEEAVGVHDDLARELDPAHVADWSGFEALVRQFRGGDGVGTSSGSG